MKIQSVSKAVVIFGLTLAFALPLAASADSTSNRAVESIWPRVEALISRCAVRTYTIQNGTKSYGYLRPTCDDIQLGNHQAYLQVDGEWYTATIEDAADSDDGDLNNVYVFDMNGSTIAQRREVLAFGDILLALNGGHAQLPEVYVRN